MPFLAPLALAGLVFVPLVVAMYLLKLRRDEAVVPSTLLWQRLVADVEANAPWQRLRRSLLLLLQLLLVLILVLLAARPFVERPAGLAGDLVLVIDTSASMQATDVTPNRLEAAKSAAIDALKDLPAGGKVSVIAAGRTAKVIANGTGDIGRVKQAIASITPTVGHRQPVRRPAARVRPRGPLGRRGDPGRDRRRAGDAAGGLARGAGPGPARGPRRREPGDRRARRADRAERPVAQRVHLGRQRRPRAGGPPAPALRRRAAARLADAAPRPAAPDRRLHRRHRRHARTRRPWSRSASSARRARRPRPSTGSASTTAPGPSCRPSRRARCCSPASRTRTSRRR